MSRKSYPSDLTDEQWEILGPLLPPAKPGGRPRTVDLREVVNGILYLLRSGCPWRMVPHDLPPWQTLYKYFRSWTMDGTWERVNETLRPCVREAARVFGLHRDTVRKMLEYSVPPGPKVEILLPAQRS